MRLQDNAFSMSDRAKSTGFGGFDPNLARLSAPSSYPAQQASHNPTALHSAPYDLSLAYSSHLDSVPPPSMARRGQYDRSALLQGWGGMNACDFGTGKY